MTPQDIQARVFLTGLLYRATLRAFNRTLLERGLAPPFPEEKMHLHKEVEQRVWDIPASAAHSVADRDVDDGVDGVPELEQEVVRMVEHAVGEREVH